MSNQIFLFALLGILSMGTIILLSLALMMKLRRMESLNRLILELKTSLDEMDEQAKLIVRTDLELNKTYEELDKRINALYALQRISQSLSKTLDQNEIFKSLEPEHLREIGFRKMLIFTAGRNKNTVMVKHRLGFNPEETKTLEIALDKEKVCAALSDIEITFSSAENQDKDNPLIKTIKKISGLNSFIVSPIFKKSGLFGFILLGNVSEESPLTGGDQELVTILATQIGQALDNAELFESAYSQHQELEKKVIARTKELSDALNEIKAISKRKTDFVSSVSHELRTPLTSIKGYASILLAEKMGTLPEEIKERLAKINKHSDELVHMVNDLLDIARIESGRFEMKLEPLDIRGILTGIIDLLGPQLKEKSANVQIELPQNLSAVSADKTQISRVFINLLSNAIKFVPEKNGIIKISASEAKDILQVNISDNGIGMAPEDCQRVFEEFYRVDNVINQKVKGTGLGLTLVKNILQAHKGKIWVESKPGQGATFSFTLPKN